SDQHIFRLKAAIDAFRFRDDEWFDFEDPDLLPENDSMREVIELMTSLGDSELVCGYYEGFAFLCAPRLAVPIACLPTLGRPPAVGFW
ncbi:MAG: hypothetical protein ACI9R3_006008, partial [Verrucomicrobiales bacterium]